MVWAGSRHRHRPCSKGPASKKLAKRVMHHDRDRCSPFRAPRRGAGGVRVQGGVDSMNQAAPAARGDLDFGRRFGRRSVEGNAVPFWPSAKPKVHELLFTSARQHLASFDGGVQRPDDRLHYPTQEFCSRVMEIGRRSAFWVANVILPKSDELLKTIEAPGSLEEP